MKKNTRHRRIYYVPGFITLVIAPIIFMIRTDQYISDSSQHCISIVLGEKANKYEQNIFPKRVYQSFQINGHSKRDSANLILIENISKGLELSKNDSLGVKVTLGKNIKYGTYIDLLNACLKSGINNWIPLGDTLFIFHRDYKNHGEGKFAQNFGDCPIMICSCVISNKPKYELTIFQKIKNNLESIKLATPFMIIILILAYLTIRRNKNEG